MNKLLNYEYNDDQKTLYIEILMKDISIGNSLELKIKLNDLKLSRIKSVLIDMLVVSSIDKSGIEVLMAYKKLLNSYGIKVLFENNKVL